MYFSSLKLLHHYFPFFYPYFFLYHFNLKKHNKCPNAIHRNRAWNFSKVVACFLLSMPKQTYKGAKLCVVLLSTIKQFGSHNMPILPPWGVLDGRNSHIISHDIYWSRTIRIMILQQICSVYNNNFIKAGGIYSINYTVMWSGVHTGDCRGGNGDIWTIISTRLVEPIGFTRFCQS